MFSHYDHYQIDFNSTNDYLYDQFLSLIQVQNKQMYIVLQEILAKLKLQYFFEITEQSPQNYRCTLIVENQIISYGDGNSKNKAKQNAALNSLKPLLNWNQKFLDYFQNKFGNQKQEIQLNNKNDYTFYQQIPETFNIPHQVEIIVNSTNQQNQLISQNPNKLKLNDQQNISILEKLQLYMQKNYRSNPQWIIEKQDQNWKLTCTVQIKNYVLKLEEENMNKNLGKQKLAEKILEELILQKDVIQNQFQQIIQEKNLKRKQQLKDKKLIKKVKNLQENQQKLENEQSNISDSQQNEYQDQLNQTNMTKDKLNMGEQTIQKEDINLQIKDDSETIEQIYDDIISKNLIQNCEIQQDLNEKNLDEKIKVKINNILVQNKNVIQELQILYQKLSKYLDAKEIQYFIIGSFLFKELRKNKKTLDMVCLVNYDQYQAYEFKTDFSQLDLNFNNDKFNQQPYFSLFSKNDLSISIKITLQNKDYELYKVYKFFQMNYNDSQRQICILVKNWRDTKEFNLESEIIHYLAYESCRNDNNILENLNTFFLYILNLNILKNQFKYQNKQLLNIIENSDFSKVQEEAQVLIKNNFKQLFD